MGPTKVSLVLALAVVLGGAAARAADYVVVRPAGRGVTSDGTPVQLYVVVPQKPGSGSWDGGTQKLGAAANGIEAVPGVSILVQRAGSSLVTPARLVQKISQGPSLSARPPSGPAASPEWSGAPPRPAQAAVPAAYVEAPATGQTAGSDPCYLGALMALQAAQDKDLKTIQQVMDDRLASLAAIRVMQEANTLAVSKVERMLTEMKSNGAKSTEPAKDTVGAFGSPADGCELVRVPGTDLSTTLSNLRAVRHEFEDLSRTMQRLSERVPGGEKAAPRAD